jgi:hypothetical protein
VNQTRPHCVNQMGKTHSKPLAARHGRGTAWARHAMCESAFILFLECERPQQLRKPKRETWGVEKGGHKQAHLYWSPYDLCVVVHLKMTKCGYVEFILLQVRLTFFLLNGCENYWNNWGVSTFSLRFSLFLKIIVQYLKSCTGNFIGICVLCYSHSNTKIKTIKYAHVIKK